jgi:hypothetical protein
MAETENLISAYSRPTTYQGSNKYHAQMDKEQMTTEAEEHLIKGVTASRNRRGSNDEMEYIDNETKKKGERCNKGRGGKSAAQKSNKITSTPSRPGMQVTPNSKMTGG